MNITHPNNFVGRIHELPQPYGFRLRLPTGDPFGKVIGFDWQREYWFATAVERDAQLIDMTREHEYSRRGDKPALAFQKLENLVITRGL